MRACFMFARMRACSLSSLLLFLSLSLMVVKDEYGSTLCLQGCVDSLHRSERERERESDVEYVQNSNFYVAKVCRVLGTLLSSILYLLLYF